MLLDACKLRPTRLENCIIANSSLQDLLSCNFQNTNVLLRGRAGVGKTLICKIVKLAHPYVAINEDILNFNLTAPSISTTTNLHLYSSVFDKIIDIVPVSKLMLLKRLSVLTKDHISLKSSLFSCINVYYPNINKILNCYLNEN